uniref:Uncharacterized protein n=1 Tax=Tetranychus urticae TaxID=32264 RepID=T1L5H7_TETUR
MLIKMQRKTILTTFIRIFCVVVFIFQFYLLTKDYLQFNVDKEVTNYIDDAIEIPEVHIAIPYYYALDINLLLNNKSSFHQACRAFFNKDNCNNLVTDFATFGKWVGHTLTLSDIAKYSYLTETFIKKIYWSRSSEDPLKTGKCKIIRKASSTTLVLVIRCVNSHGLPLKLSRAKAIIFNSNALFNFTLNTTMMLMKLNYPGKALIDDSSLHLVGFSTKGKQTWLGIRFTKHTETSLPPPYKTMCRNYDRRKTFEDCLNAHSIEQTGMLFPGTAVSLDKYSTSSQMRFNSPFYGNSSSIIMKIYRQCQSVVTQQMCNMVRYSYRMVTSSQDIAQDGQKMRIFFTATAEPGSLTESKPDFPLSDYLILSGSLFSTWFGISIMGQLLAASHLLCKPYRKSTDKVDFKTKIRPNRTAINTIRPRYNKSHNNLTIISPLA